MLTTFTCIHKETKEKIKYDDYKKLSDEEKAQYNVYPKMQVFRVFNVAQTNLQEARPELWEQLERENGKRVENGEHFSFGPVDAMIKDNLWICPIKPTHQNEAYYSITKNEIVVPEKEQFRDGESFYGRCSMRWSIPRVPKVCLTDSNLPLSVRKSMPARNWWPNWAARWSHNATA